MKLDADHVMAAYKAMGSGNRDEILQYWSEDLVFSIPGHSQVAGMCNGLDEYLAFRRKCGELSDHSTSREVATLIVGDDYTADVGALRGHRAEDPSKMLDIDTFHWLRWEDGKVVEGKGGSFGKGQDEYDDFWGQA